MWKEYNLNPEKGEGFDNEKTKLMMQEAYDGFMEYIERIKEFEDLAQDIVNMFLIFKQEYTNL